MEFEELGTMDCSGSTVQLKNEGGQPDFRQVAWLLRERLSDFVDGDLGEPPDLGLRNLLNRVVSRKIVSVDPQRMNPVLWRTLPKHLLLLVLARLPVPDVARLRCLSREWRRDLATVNSDINRTCDDVSPRMVALLSRSGGDESRSVFFVTIFDLSKLRPRYSYPLHLSTTTSHGNGWETMGAGAMDGGLACFVSTWKSTSSQPFCIVVMNLLTQDRRELQPPFYMYNPPPTMVHIQVDSETKYYKLTVVGRLVRGKIPTSQVYDSETRKWAGPATPGHSLFGVAYKWKFCKDSQCFKCPSRSQTPCVFRLDLKLCTENNLAGGDSGSSSALQRDRLFVLHKPELRSRSLESGDDDGAMLSPGDRLITDHQFAKNAKHWVEAKSHACPPFQELGSRSDDAAIGLSACEGFLVAAAPRDGMGCLSRFLDLTTGEWSEQPERFDRHGYGTSLCRAFWNVIP